VVTVRGGAQRRHGRSQRYARQGSTGPACDGVLRLATNRLDVPAEIIALLYHFRWTIEIFFRFLKQILGCRHLLSRSQNGIEIQTYCAIIACMLISLWTGKRPTLRTHELICWYLIGLAHLADLPATIARLKNPAACPPRPARRVRRRPARRCAHILTQPSEPTHRSNARPRLPPSASAPLSRKRSRQLSSRTALTAAPSR